MWVNVDFMAMCMRARNWVSPWQSAVFYGALDFVVLFNEVHLLPLKIRFLY